MTETWPQPREGIRGTDMTGSWLLSLDSQAVAHRDTLIAVARHLRTATMVGSPAPVVQRMAERMRSPRRGDLVAAVEVLYGSRPLEDRIMGMGIYLGGRREWAETDEQWEAFCARERELYDGDDPDADLSLTCSPDNRATDTVFYIQYGPSADDVCRWHNSEAVVLMSELWPLSADAAAERSGTSVTFTRDSLTAGLADSGIYLRGQAPDLTARPGQLVIIRTDTGEITDVRDITATVARPGRP